MAHCLQEKGGIGCETVGYDSTSKYSSTDKASVVTVLTQNAKSTKKKKKKKKKSKDDRYLNSESEETSSNQMANLTLETSSSDHPQIAARPVNSNPVHIDRDEKVLKRQGKSSILQVDPKFLNAENELRRIFGSRVVKSYEKHHSSANPRLPAGGRRGNHHFKRTILVSPSQHWPRWDGSLTMELLETRDGVHYFRYMQSSSYTAAQRAFDSAKALHDLNGIANILLNHPYHTESLIVLADYFKFTGEHQMSSDATAKCLYAMECAWHPLFTPSQNCQLKFVHDTNKPFFSSLFTHMKNMDRRGCHRSALEICKLLLSVDSDDPMGAMFCIDYYSLRAEEYAWLEQFAEEYRHDNSLWLFPNFSYSLAVCRFYLERSETNGSGEAELGKATSSDLMKQALMLHPSVLKKLVEKVPLKDRIWTTTILKHSFFRSEQTGSPSLDHLISMYVERNYLIWRLPELQKLLCDSALSVIETLDGHGSDAKDWACVRKEAFSSEKNEYSHLMVSDFSDSVPTLPPDNLQNFIIDQRGGNENIDRVPNAPANRAPQDFLNRNALAVLFESMLPWINYGPGEGEHIQPDHHGPGRADNEE
ncbi:uncharacterized protein LOC127254741 isoform X2 [Andrographis paniculata]|uniref:uncharacterized protein LOC127254741 isoform X2 n=1 Tax=Andrographis paniculata TaxID=175694 RepID=UPI0021E74288|nr:uncharacterized protein LOC127254741 isoform X2 [Andrographis paniculata]